MLPDFPKFKNILIQQQVNLLEFAKWQNLNGYFRKIPHVTVYEGRGFQFQYTDKLTYESGFNTIEDKFELSISELKKNPDLIYEQIYQTGVNFANSQVKMTFQTVEDVTNLTGNVLASNDPLPEQFLQMLEKMPISFDSDGRPIMPSIHSGEEMYKKIVDAFAAINENEIYLNRMNALMEKKKKEAHDRENNRKLVG